MNRFGEAMRRCRLLSGLSLKELEKQSGVSYSLISFYESGRVSPGLENLVRLADVFQIPVDAYIGRSVAAKKEDQPLC